MPTTSAWRRAELLARVVVPSGRQACRLAAGDPLARVRRLHGRRPHHVSALRIGGGIWRYVAVDIFIKIVQAAALTLAIFLLLLFSLTRLELFPRSFVLIDFFILVGLLAAPRFGYRLIKDRELSSLFERGTHRRVPVLLVGSGDGTDLFIREMTRTRDAPFRVVGILDDGDSRVGRTIRGIKVLGTVGELEDIAARLARRGLAPERLIITRSAMDGSIIADLIDRADALGIGIGRLPRLTTFDRADSAGGNDSGSLSPRDPGRGSPWQASGGSGSGGDQLPDRGPAGGGHRGRRHDRG